MQMLGEFEAYVFNVDQSAHLHHEQSPSKQKRFKTDVLKLFDVLDEEIIFNTTNTNDLFTLCSHTVAHLSVADTAKTAWQKGNQKFQSYFSEQLGGGTSIFTPKNKLPLFSYRPLVKIRSVHKLKLREAKTGYDLFSQMFVACQSRERDLDVFFRHENHPNPLSISQGGILCFETKSD